VCSDSIVMSALLNLRRTNAICVLATLAAWLGAQPSQGDLASRYSSGQQRAGQLNAGIQADTHKLQGYQGTIDTLQARLAVIQSSVSTQERLLTGVRTQLSAARLRLQDLERQYARDRALLATELRSEYETPSPTVVGVIVDAHGFEDLLNGLHNLKAIEHENAQITGLVAAQRLAVSAQARRLAVVQARRQRATAAVLVERDQVAQLRLSIVDRELAVAGVRARKLAQLNSLRRTLSREAAMLDQRAAAAQAASSGGAARAPAGCVNTPFVAHGGPSGFFPAAGTNYSVGQEPIIAARLDALGRALQLQLTGISGYRTPQHSVEVGGFADDPHTQGIASDTPGVEGVPEATLARFCLTRPFPGPREADHIQEL
jgi:peptidoglycan hydrolase CwlO-like protein